MADVLVVQSKVHEYVKRKGMNMAGDFAAALSKEVATLIERAAKRAKANGRKTVRPDDL
ncbi:MAG: DUF1931 domain-containing protein [Candidatus Diapherotrites archaeon]|nr:DUF1931 domain-containing protein [Candidatus Diapherotrites archaeon]